MRVVMLWVLCLVVGCAGRFPPGPRQGGAPWTELTSEHFTVWTDADPAAVRPLIDRMEHLRRVILGIAHPTASTTGRALVIVVRNDWELTEISNTGEPRAFVSYPSALWQPMIVLSLTGSRNEALVHELTHLVSFPVIRNQPRWLAEGMAMFFETMVIDPVGTRVVVGSGLRHGRRRPPWVPVHKLLGWRGQRESQAEWPYYYTAWWLFAFLFNEHADAFGRYLWLVDRTAEPRDPDGGTVEELLRRAWTQAFPALPLDRVDAALHDWVSNGKHLELAYDVRRAEWPITQRQLGHADTHAIRAVLLDGPRLAQREQARAEIAEAFAAEPLNVLAWFVGPESPSVETAQAIVAAHPDDWRAWALLTDVLERAKADPAVIDPPLQRTCALMAPNPLLPLPQRCPDRRAGRPAPASAR